MPTRTYAGELQLTVGEVQVKLIHTNIHSDDATVLWLPAQGLLLCGDTMEDTVTYVDEPQSFDAHLENLEPLRELGADRILPNHGDPDVIEGGGYGPGLITATERYVRALQRSREEPALRELAPERVDGRFAPGGVDHVLPALRGGPSREPGDGAGPMNELTSASVPPIGDDDHVTGEGAEVIVYADFGCPYCAAGWARIRELPLRLCFRHFPMASEHPRAPALHAAAEAGPAPRMPSGRCATRSTPTGGGSTTRICGSGRSVSASISSGFGPTAARTRSASGSSGFRQRNPGGSRRDADRVRRGRTLQGDLVAALEALAGA